MDTINDSTEKHYITLADACALLNRDVEHLQEFIDDSDVKLETVDGEVVMDVESLLEHITDVALDMSE